MKARPHILATGALCIAFSVGAPNACMGVNPADSEPTQVGSGTWKDPFVVRRDNLSVGGTLEIGDKTTSATVSSPFLTDGRWKNLSGHFAIDEEREHQWHYTWQYTPLLPGSAFDGPGSARYGTRAGSMVHGNRYVVSMKASSDAGESFSFNDTTVKLSDDVAVVPVVIVSWKNPKGQSNDNFVDETVRARTMFDFNPVATVSASSPASYFRLDHSEMKALPLLAKDPLGPWEIDGPISSSIPPPDAIELPPDEIWQQCGIQFQVVAQFTFRLPEDWKNDCNVNALSLADAEWRVYDALAGTPALRDYLVKDLKPIYVSYGDLADCATGWGSHSFVGNTPGKNRFIEINFARHRNTTAHELGHALKLDHLYEGGATVEGNLMRENPRDEQKLTDAQCKAARYEAMVLSQRYDQFNINTGRVYSELPPLPPSQSGGGSEQTPIDPGSGTTDICCKAKDASDVAWTKAGTCAGNQVDDAMCLVGCCSIDKQSMTAYQCGLKGGTIHSCVK